MFPFAYQSGLSTAGYRNKAILTWTGPTNGSQELIVGTPLFFSTAGLYVITVQATMVVKIHGVASGGTTGTGTGGFGAASNAAGFNVTVLPSHTYHLNVGADLYFADLEGPTFFSRLSGTSVIAGSGVAGAAGGNAGTPGRVGNVVAGGAAGGGGGGEAPFGGPDPRGGAGGGGGGGGGNPGVGGGSYSLAQGGSPGTDENGETGGGGAGKGVQIPGSSNFYGGGGGGGGRSAGAGGVGGPGAFSFILVSSS